MSFQDIIGIVIDNVEFTNTELYNILLSCKLNLSPFRKYFRNKKTIVDAIVIPDNTKYIPSNISYMLESVSIPYLVQRYIERIFMNSLGILYVVKKSENISEIIVYMRHLSRRYMTVALKLGDIIDVVISRYTPDNQQVIKSHISYDQIFDLITSNPNIYNEYNEFVPDKLDDTYNREHTKIFDLNY